MPIAQGFGLETNLSMAGQPCRASGEGQHIMTAREHPPPCMCTKQQICSFMRLEADTLYFDLVNVQRQDNGSDCGVFALANATELTKHRDPVLCSWHFQKNLLH